MKVKFLVDDTMGLWKKGDVAEDWGWESGRPHPPIRLLYLYGATIGRGEFITLTDPFERGLCEQVDG